MFVFFVIIFPIFTFLTYMFVFLGQNSMQNELILLMQYIGIQEKATMFSVFVLNQKIT